MKERLFLFRGKFGKTFQMFTPKAFFTLFLYPWGGEWGNKYFRGKKFAYVAMLTPRMLDSHVFILRGEENGRKKLWGKNLESLTLPPKMLSLYRGHEIEYTECHSDLWPPISVKLSVKSCRRNLYNWLFLINSPKSNISFIWSQSFF